MQGAQTDPAAGAAQRGAGPGAARARRSLQVGGSLPAPSGVRLPLGLSSVRGEAEAPARAQRAAGPRYVLCGHRRGLRAPGGEPPSVRGAPCLARREMTSNSSTPVGACSAPPRGQEPRVGAGGGGSAAGSGAGGRDRQGGRRCVPAPTGGRSGLRRGGRPPPSWLPRRPFPGAPPPG